MPGEPLARLAGNGAAAPWRQRRRSPRELAVRHRVLLVALAAALPPRLLAAAAYQPAVLFRLDTFDYLWGAVHLAPNPVNPSGYSLFLWLLRPWHSLFLVTVLQQVMGLGVAVMGYALLRRRGLPGWVATLAVTPVLFAPAELLLERLIMGDLLAMALMVAGFAVLLWHDPASARRSASAGVLLGLSAIVRPTGVLFVAIVPAYLLIRRAGWRRAAAVLAAGALPVAGYLTWFLASSGSFNLTSSNGLFLWSRTMSFANCAIIRPPRRLRPLCPTRQPGILSVADPARRPLPRAYLWDRGAWQWQPRTRGLVPDTSAFTAARNSRALAFALRAITAQPLTYLHVVAAESLLPLRQPDMLRFPGSQMYSSSLAQRERAYAIAAVRAYTGSDQGLAPYLGYQYGTRLYAPLVFLVQDYQRFVFLPGPLLALLMLTGLAGILLPRRRVPAAVLLWPCAVIAIVAPVAEHEYVYRYAFPAVPLVCLAAALALRAPASDPLAARPPAAGTASSGQSPLPARAGR
jgi:hypothetical protein